MEKNKVSDKHSASKDSSQAPKTGKNNNNVISANYNLEEKVINKYVSSIPIKVFILDDEFLISEAMRMKLTSEEDIQFYSSQDPEEALESLQEVKPTVILQDLVMPQINGLQMLKKIKSTDGLSDIPLIVLSAREEPELKARALALGADDYMVKLPEKHDLIIRIRIHSKGYIYKKQRDEAILRLEQSKNGNSSS